MIGFATDGDPPATRHCVLIGAPHTTNWDFFIMLAYAALYDLRISFIGKHILFIPPLGWLMRALGGIPVVRHKQQNAVNAIADLFDEHQNLMLVMSPEGTRSYTDYWRSGFYYIAHTAGVPILPASLDYQQRILVFGAPLQTTGRVEEDMDVLREFYKNARGKYPEKAGPVRLQGEKASPDGV